MLPTKWIALLAAGSALAFFATACGGGSSKSTGVSITDAGTPGAAAPANFTPISTPAGVPTAVGSPAPESDIQQISDNYAKVKSFRVQISQGTGDKAATTSLEVVQPDQLHITIKSAQLTQENICLGKTLYTNKDGKWTKSDKDQNGTAIDCAQAISATFNTKAIADGIKQASDAKQIAKGGTDTVNGKKCQLYTQTNPNGTTADICVADGLLLRVVDKTAGATLLFSDYNANIDIKAPI